MANFYYEMAWLFFTLELLGIIGILVFLSIYIVRNNRLIKKVDYMQKQFNTHFKVTTKTIEDTREERDWWKKKATKA